MAVKLYISQPMHGKCMNDIMAERKQLVAEAAVALRTDDILVLDTLFINHDKPSLEMLGRSIEKMAEADAVIFAPGWKDARGSGSNTSRRPSMASKSSTGRGDERGDHP